MSQRNRVLLTVAIFLLALVPRALPTPFYTTDEILRWTGRTDRFFSALRAGDLGGTVQAYHPGVTTMWLGSGGVLLAEALTGTPAAEMNLLHHLVIIRLPAAVVHAFGVGLGYVLLRRLLTPQAALLGALFWALDPFHIAHSQVFHIDALTATFVTLAFLAGLVAFHADDDPQVAGVRWGWLVFSAVMGGLAALTKLTMLYVSAPLGLVALEMRESWFHQPQRWRRLYRYVVWPMAVWTAIVFVTWFALYPGAWVNLRGVYEALFFGVELATRNHRSGSFFWGAPVADPGRWYYPVVIALRVVPWVLVGLLAAAGRVFRQGWHGRTTIAALIGFSVGFVLLMLLQPKKLDRYMLPIFPALNIIAAVGVLWLITIARRWWPALRRVPARLGWAAVVGVYTLMLLWYYPYLNAYYNPLLGGGRAAAFTVDIGWGEGFDEAARYIREQTEADDCTALAAVKTNYEDHLRQYDLGCAEVVTWSEDFSETDFVVTYIEQVQRGEHTTIQLLLAQVADDTPGYTVHIHGIDYAHVYDLRASR